MPCPVDIRGRQPQKKKLSVLVSHPHPPPVVTLIPQLPPPGPPLKMLSLLAAIALVAPAHAGLRFPCSTLTIQRLDPVVEPGALPAAHVHHIVGGNAFNATMEGDIGEKATCTTCQMSEDFSNYWFVSSVDSIFVDFVLFMERFERSARGT